MTDDRSLERAARRWLEAGPTQAPDRAVEAALTRIQATTQERDLWIPWRPRTMFDRLAVAAMAAVVGIGTLTLGASLLLNPNEPAAVACPAAHHEASAVDTFAPGLTQAQRAWGIAGGAPGHVGARRIAAFQFDAAAEARSLIAIDPSSGDRCVLVRFSDNPPVQGPGVTSLDWSPSGHALAIGLGGPEGPEGPEDGQVLIWTPSRLYRVWTGPETPYLEWAPDGRSLAVWMGILNGRPPETRLIFADGSPDRTFNVGPWRNGLEWSPDGSRWIVAQQVGQNVLRPITALAIVSVADGRVTPLDSAGKTWLEPVRWLEPERLVLMERQRDGKYGYWDMPVASPQELSVVPLPDAALTGSAAAFSPDGARAAYLSSTEGGDLFIVDVTGSTPGTPIQIDPGFEVAPYGLAWSPDGSQLVLLADRSPPDDAVVEYGVWVVNADGTGLREIAIGNIVPVDDPWQPVAER